MEWHIKQELSRVGEENEHMLRCRAKEEWICHTGGLFPHLPRPTTANQTKQTLTCCGQLEGWKGRDGEDSPVEQEGRRLHP